MVVCRNIGQLGNNMFQIAAAIGYARKYGYEWAADYGRGVSDPWSKIHECFPNLPKHELGGNRFHEHPNEFCQLHGVHKNECHFDYHPIPNMGGNVTFTGFFQSWKYFEGQDEEIKKVFALPHIAGYEDFVSIHVRRGDYVQHAGSFPPITKEYLYQAMAVMTERYKPDGGYKIIWFSDDIQWCKDNFGDMSTQDIFSEGRSTFDDLCLMASCGHHIIANSTYSYWGAFLGHNPNKIVISPSCKRGNWFGGSAGIRKDVVDLLPPDWIQIEFRTI